MNELLIAHRFQSLQEIAREGRVSLELVRDVAAENTGWLLGLHGRDFAEMETAIRLRLELLGTQPLFRRWKTKVAFWREPTLHMLLEPRAGRSWADALAEMAADEAAAEIDRLGAALQCYVDQGIRVDALRCRHLYRDEDGPFLLPAGYVLPPAMSEHGSFDIDFVDFAACRRDALRLWEEVGELSSEIASASHAQRQRWIAVTNHWAEQLGEADDASQDHHEVLGELDRFAAEGGCIVLSGRRDLGELGPAVEAWCRERRRYPVVLRPHVRPPLRGRDVVSGFSGALLVMAHARDYAAFAEGLQRMGREGWIDGREIVVVCPGDDPPDEPFRLHLSSLRSRAGDRFRELQLPRAATLGEAEDTSGLERRVIEALSVAGRPLSERLLRQAFAMEPSELSAVVAALVRGNRVDALVGHHDEAPSTAQLILDVKTRAQLVPGPERRHEVELLLDSSLENVTSRGAAGRAWLRAQSANRNDPRRALPLLRTVRDRARKDGLHLLEYSAGEQLVRNAATLHARQEDRVQAAICMGEQHRLHGEIQRADEILGSALRELETRTDAPTSRVAPLACELTLKLGMLAMHRANYPLAEARLTEVLERYKDDLSAIHRARIYLDLSWALLQMGRTRECMSYCELTLKLLDTERYPAEVARAYNQLGFAQYKESDYDESVRNHQRCLVLREQLGDELAVARSYNNLALSYRALGKLTEAERCLRQSLELKKRAGDNLGRAASGLNLGFVFLDQGRPSAARERAEECLGLARGLQNLEMEAEASGLLGEIAMADGDLEEARRLLQIDLEICERTGHRTEQLATLRRLISVLLELGELDEAATCLEGARTLQKEQPSRYEAGMLDRLEAELLIRSGAAEPAVDLLAAAARTLGSLRRREQQLDCLARKGQEELRQGHVLQSRTTLGEAQDLIARHEIHRIPQSLNRLSADLESFPVDEEPPGAGLCLSALADMLTAGGGIQGGRVESALLGLRTALVCEQLYWIPDERAQPRRLEGTGLVETTLPSELTGRLDSDISREEIVRHENWVALRLGQEGGGWLALSRLKPLDPDELAFARSVAGVLTLIREARADVRLQSASSVESPLGAGVERRFVARSEAMRQVLRTVDTIGDHDVTVLILGENGTGKDVVARAIHESGPRRDHEFVAVNCASIPPSLLESELFGHERGAFTSAYDRRIGVFERAHGGTIFLDEIGDMSLDMQAKLLRVLQDKSFSRVGGSETLHTDVRILAATNRDLRQEVAQGRFRMDLFYRLNVITIELPPLRERPEDIEPLIDHFLQRFGPELGSRVRTVSAEALGRLRAYAWPGNVRELENVLKSAMVFASGETLRPEELPAAVLAERGQGGGPTVEEAVRSIVATDDCTAERPLMPRVELLLVHEMVRRTGNKTLAARLLGITKPTLYNRLRRFRALYGTPEDELGD